MGMILSWAGIAFETLGLDVQKLRHHQGGRWKPHDIIGRRPASQYLGPAMEVIEIEGCVWPWLTGVAVTAAVAGLAAAAEAGQISALVSAAGDIYGDFYLLDAPVESGFFGGDGRPQKMSYTLKFQRAADIAGLVWTTWP